MSQVQERLRLTARGWRLLQVAAVAALGSIAVLGVVGEDVTQHNGLSTDDPAHLRFFVDHRPHALVSVARALTDVGAVPVLLVLSLLAGATLWWRRQSVLVAVAPIVALLVSGAVVAVAKDVVGRARPDVALRLASDNEASFPSGHSADSAALFVTLAIVLAAFVLRRPLARAATVLAGVAASGAIGLSRLVLAVHWPTDVLAGWALGLLVAVTIGTAVVLADHLAVIPAERIRRYDRFVARLLSRRETAAVTVADAAAG